MILTREQLVSSALSDLGFLDGGVFDVQSCPYVTIRDKFGTWHHMRLRPLALSFRRRAAEVIQSFQDDPAGMMAAAAEASDWTLQADDELPDTSFSRVRNLAHRFVHGMEDAEDEDLWEMLCQAAVSSHIYALACGLDDLDQLEEL